jgi:adenosylcobinamide-GDP ribazoletransferase
LGLLLVLSDRLLEPHLPSEILSLVLVTLLILMTRGLHLDGLGDTFDGLGAKGGRENALKAMADSRTGIFGLLAVVVVIAFKLRAVELITEERWQALLLAPLLGRWAMVVLAYGSESAREGLGQMMVQHVGGWNLFFATAITLISVSALSGRTGLWIALWISLLTAGSRSYFHRRLGGLTGDTFGAVGELSETLALVFFAVVQR